MPNPTSGIDTPLFSVVVFVAFASLASADERNGGSGGSAKPSARLAEVLINPLRA